MKKEKISKTILPLVAHVHDKAIKAGVKLIVVSFEGKEYFPRQPSRSQRKQFSTDTALFSREYECSVKKLNSRWNATQRDTIKE